MFVSTRHHDAHIAIQRSFDKGLHGRIRLPPAGNRQNKRVVPSGEPTFCHGKSQFLIGKSTISMAIFNCYVSSPEGIRVIHLFSHYIGVSENRLVPLNPMVLLIIIPMKNGYFIGNINPTFSDNPTCQTLCVMARQGRHQKGTSDLHQICSCSTSRS